MRFYGFDAQEIVNDQHPNLELEHRPEASWALRNPEHFPVDSAMILSYDFTCSGYRCSIG